MISTGDIFFCNVKKTSNIFWKSSDYIFVKDIIEGYVHMINSNAEEKTLSATFVQHLLKTNVLLKVDADDEKAKALLASFGKVRKIAIILT